MSFDGLIPVQQVYGHDISNSRIVVSDLQYTAIWNRVAVRGTPIVGNIPARINDPTDDGYYWINIVRLRGIYCEPKGDPMKSITCAQYYESEGWELVRVHNRNIDFFGSDEGFHSSEYCFIVDVRKVDLYPPDSKEKNNG